MDRNQFLIEIDNLYEAIRSNEAQTEDYKFYMDLNIKLKSISNYIETNYSSIIRKHMLQSDFTNNSDLLDKYDDFYLKKWKENDLLKNINDQIINIGSSQDINSEHIELITKEMYYFLSSWNTFELISEELLLYLSLIKSFCYTKEYSPKSAEEIIRREFKDKHQIIIVGFKQIAYLMDNINKNYVFLNVEKLLNKIKNKQASNLYLLYVSTLEFIETQYDSLRNRIESLLIIFRDKRNCELINSTIIIILLNYFVQCIDKGTSEEKKIIINFFTKKEFFESLIRNKEYDCITELIFYFSSNEELVYNYYLGLKQLHSLFYKHKDEDNISFQKLQFSLFYLNILAKAKKNQKKFSLLSKINSENVNGSFLFIHSIFIYLNSELRETVKENQNNLSLFFEDIEKEKNPIFPPEFNDCIENIYSINETEFFFEKYVKLANCVYIKDCQKIFNDYLNNSTIFVNQLKTIKPSRIYSNYPNILYCQLPINNIIISTDNFIKKHMIVPIDKKINDCYYQCVMKGFIFVINNYKTEICLFDRYSLSFYLVSAKEWRRTLKIPRNINKLYVVYFIKPIHKNFLLPKELQYKNFFQNTDEKEKFEKVLLFLYSINPKILKMNLTFVQNFFGLVSIEMFLQFYNKIYKLDDFVSNEEGKELILYLIEQLNIQHNSNLEEIIKNSKLLNFELFFEIMEQYINDKNPAYYFQKIPELIMWNLKYYFDNILQLKNVPDLILFWIMLLIAWSLIPKQGKKKQKEFDNEWFEKYFFDDNSQEKFKLLSSVFDKKKFSFNNIESYYEKIDIQNIELTNNFRLLAQLLIIMVKLQHSKIEEIKQSLNKVFIQHPYLFCKTSNDIKHKEDTKFGIIKFFEYLKFAIPKQNLQEIIDFIFEFELNEFIQQNEPCFSYLKQLAVESYISNLIEGEFLDKFPNTYKNKKIRKNLQRSRRDCKNIEALFLIEFYLDYCKLEKETKKIQCNNLDEYSSNKINDIKGIYLPFFILNKHLKQQVQNYLLQEKNKSINQNVGQDIEFLNFFNSLLQNKAIEQIDDIHKIDNVSEQPAFMKFIEKTSKDNRGELIKSSNLINFSFYIKRGIVVFTENKKFIYICNKYNNYWYSLNENKWKIHLGTHLENIGVIIKYIEFFFYTGRKDIYRHFLVNYKDKKVELNKHSYSQSIIDWYRSYHFYFYQKQEKLFKKLFLKKENFGDYQF